MPIVGGIWDFITLDLTEVSRCPVAPTDCGLSMIGCTAGTHIVLNAINTTTPMPKARRNRG